MRFKGYATALLLVILILLIPIVHSLTFDQQINSVTQTIRNVPYYYVDNNLSNVDSSGDKGTHSNFTAQQYSPDSTFDNLTEENVGSDQIIEDYIDNNTSDIDSTPDVGSHSNFSAQQASPDAIYDTLTEENTYSIQEGSIQASWSADISTSTKYPNDGGDFVGNGGYGKLRTAVKFPLDQLPSNAIITGVNFTIYCYEGGTATHQVDLHPYNDDGQADPQVDSASTAYSRCAPIGVPYIDDSPDLRTVGLKEFILSSTAYTDIENAKASVNIFSLGLHEEGDDDWYACLVEYTETNTDWRPTLHISYYTSSSYELDLEVQFTDVINYLTSETLCVYTGTLGAEDLHLDFWNGTGWENLATDLTANSWNNYTVSLTSTTFTIRFKGGTETTDTTEDQWKIDAVLLRVEGSGNLEDAVDSDTSDVDFSSDLGNLVNFDNMKTADSTYANLTESASGGGITLINVAEASATSGTSAQINKPINTAENDFMIALLVSTIGSDNDGSTMSSAPPGWTLEHDYTQSAASGQHVYIYWKIAGASEPSSYSWAWTSSCGWVAQITTFRGIDTSSPIHVEGAVNQESSSSPMSPSMTTTEDNCMIWLYDMCDDDDVPFSGGEPSGTSWIDQTEIGSPGNGLGISTAYLVQASAGATGDRDWTLDNSEENSGQQYALKPAPTDSRLDQEVQWTDVPYSLPNEELSIYGGNMGDEDIEVDVWNGTGWETIFTDLSSGWNNVSITEWLNTSTFTIRFRGGTEVGDTSPDTWQIDVALIHVWNVGENYELDLEVQWTNVDYSEGNEELCIYGGTMGSENVKVDVWNGSTWQNLFADLTNGWNNVTVTSYLTSSTFTIRFEGGTETSDSTQDVWQIDTTLLHVWS